MLRDRSIIAELVRELEDDNQESRQLIAQRLAEQQFPAEDAYQYALDAAQCLNSQSDFDFNYWLHLFYQNAMDEARSPSSNGSPSIVLSQHEAKDIPKAAMSLRGAHNVYNFGGKIAQIGKHPELETDVIRLFNKDQTRLLLSEQAKYYRLLKSGHKPTTVPDYIVSFAHNNAADLPIPTLAGLALGPQYLGDGEILNRQGYDPRSRLYLADTFSMDFMPMDEAVAIIEYVIQNFCFKSKADKAAFVAMLLVSVSRHAIKGPVPLLAIQGNMAGCGKTKLFNIMSIMATGSEMKAQPCPEDGAEFKKVITSLMMKQPWAMLLDNMKNGSTLDSDALDALATADYWQDRILGGNDMCEAVVKMLTCITGNNIKWGGDSHRRVQLCTLETDLEKPHERNDFAEADLIDFVKRNRNRSRD